MTHLIKALLILLMAAICWESSAQTVQKIKGAQKEKPPKEKKWLKPIEKPSSSVTAAWAPMAVEHHVGIRGGYGMGMARLEPTRNTKSVLGMWNFGISYRFDVPQQKYVGCIEVDVEYLEKGYGVYASFDKEESRVYERRYSTITVPILWQPYLPLGKKGSRFYANAGPFGSYALKSSDKSYDAKTGVVFEQGSYSYDPLRDNRWEFGVTVGAGLVFAVRNFSFGVDFRYNIMLSDTYKGVNKYPTNPSRSPVDQMNLSLGVNYKFMSKKARTQKMEDLKNGIKK